MEDKSARGDLIQLTVGKAREFPIGTLLEEADGSATWWKKSRNMWQKLDPEVDVVRLSVTMAGGAFWVLRGDLPAA